MGAMACETKSLLWTASEHRPSHVQFSSVFPGFATIPYQASSTHFSQACAHFGQERALIDCSVHFLLGDSHFHRRLLFLHPSHPIIIIIISSRVYLGRETGCRLPRLLACLHLRAYYTLSVVCSAGPNCRQ